MKKSVYYSLEEVYLKRLMIMKHLIKDLSACYYQPLKLLRHVPFLSHFSQDFSKEDLVDYSLGKFCAMMQEQQ